MQNRKGLRPLTEGALLAAVTAVLVLAGFYLPVVGGLIIFLWPVPVVVVYLRHGLRTALMTVLVAGVAVGLFVGPLQAIGLVANFGLMGLALGVGFARQRSPLVALVMATGAFVVSGAISLLMGVLVAGIAPSELWAQVEAGMRGALDVYRSLGLGAEQLAKMESFMDRMLEGMRLMLPAGIVGGALFSAFINFEVARLVLRRLGWTIQPIPPFAAWRIPRAMLVVLLLGVGCVAAGDWQGRQALYVAGVNLQVLAQMAYAVGGLSLAYYYLQRWGVQKAFRILILAYVCFVPLLAQLASLAGMADSLLDFRQRTQAVQEVPERRG